MANTSRSRAEFQFATIEKARERRLSEQELADKAVAENTARLKALRLAKESSDRAQLKDKKPAVKRRAPPRK